ncbi:Cof-type HAD-IIB family hydrolase [Helcococcus kunzii]|uniref:Cof-type HAD-IIB family hydrolase n=1 Tax=Helcococcus kunzii TaxID=40091 RepID=UPI0038A7EB04
MKVCVSDVDGTIVDNLGNLSKYTIDTLIDFQNRGNLIGLASGRSYLRMMPIAKRLKMDNFDGYLIDVNGLSIYSFRDNKRKIIERLKKNEIRELFDYLKIFNSEIKFYCDDAIYTYLSEDIYNLKAKIRSEMKLPEDYPWTSGEYSWLSDPRDGYPVQRLISEISEIKHEVNKISICHEYDTLVVIQNKFKKSKFSKNFDIQFSGLRQIDIISKNISKGKALKKILNELKIEDNEIYIFGDSENDISMLELSENSYIMENSKIDNYNNQFYIAPSNNNDGVAKIINTLL